MDKRLPGIYGLRALAATSILLFHTAWVIRPPPDPLSFISSHFGYGVPLFFVVSGFSLCYSTADHVDRPRWIETYLIKRLFRIAPLFYAILTYRIISLHLEGFRIDPYTVILNLTFTFNLVPGRHESLVGAGWTIGVEMLFYVVLPIMLVCARQLRTTVVLAAIGIVVSVAARSELAAIAEVPKSYPIFSFIGNVEYFTIGILAFRVFVALRQSSIRPATIEAGALATVVATFSAIAWIPGSIGTEKTPLIGFIFGVLCVWQGLRPGAVAGCRPFLFLGKRSYSIYLVHLPTLYLLLSPLKSLDLLLTPKIGAWSFIPCAVVVMGGVFTLSSITYALIEVPGIRLGSLLICRKLASQAPPVQTLDAAAAPVK